MTTNYYSDDKIKQLRLATCKNCIHSACNGNQSNKCNLDTLACTADGGALVVVKSANIEQQCPKGYWSFTNLKKVISTSGGSSCGCGK